MSLEEYLQLVDLTGRMTRQDKRGAIPDELAAILERLDCQAEAWVATMAEPRALRGCALGKFAARAAEAARRPGGMLNFYHRSAG